MIKIQYRKVDKENNLVSFDNTLELSEFRKLFLKLKKEGFIELSKDIKFSDKDLKTFISATKLHLNENSTIFTDNFKILKMLDNNDPAKRILVIDNHNFFHRLFHAMPRMVNDEGKTVTLLKALSNFLKWFFNTQSEKYSNIIFTSEGLNLYRKQSTKDTDYPYKANRSETDPELKEQIKDCETFLEENGFLILSEYGYEADDMLASIASSFSEINIPVTAFTSDKDAYQLATIDTFQIMDPKSKESNLAKDLIEDKFGVTPELFVDYQGIVGDTADNVPGIKGFGGKIAASTLKEYGSIEGIYENISRVGLEQIEEGSKITKAKQASADKKQAKWIENKDILLISRDLCRLRRHLIKDKDLIKILQQSKLPNEQTILMLKDSFSEKGVVF